LGWNINNLGRAKNSVGKTCEFNAEQTAILKKVNTLDYELYDYAQKLAEDLSRQAAGSIAKKIQG
jgi:hypothetical protein